MRWRQSRESQNVQDYRGRPTGGGGGGMKLGLGGVVIAIIAYFIGGPDLVMRMFSGGGSAQPQGEEQIQTSQPGDEAASFVVHVLGDTEDTWRKIFEQSGQQYEDPQLAIFDRGINTACGQASSAVGPFYCPGDHKVYIDLAFFRQLETEFAAQGDFAKAYVIAHEVGHHVQTLLGTSEKVHAAQQRASEADANQLSVRLELQADCYAGIWAHDSEASRQLIEQGDIDEALNAASAVGDDTIQRRVQGQVNQESFTHGSAAQRQQWFRKGYSSGSPGECNTFQ